MKIRMRAKVHSITVAHHSWHRRLDGQRGLDYPINVMLLSPGYKDYLNASLG